MTQFAIGRQSSPLFPQQRTQIGYFDAAAFGRYPSDEVHTDLFQDLEQQPLLRSEVSEQRGVGDADGICGGTKGQISDAVLKYVLGQSPKDLGASMLEA